MLKIGLIEAKMRTNLDLKNEEVRENYICYCYLSTVHHLDRLLNEVAEI